MADKEEFSHLDITTQYALGGEGLKLVAQDQRYTLIYLSNMDEWVEYQRKNCEDMPGCEFKELVFDLGEYGIHEILWQDLKAWILSRADNG